MLNGLIVLRVSAQFLDRELASEMYVDDRLTGAGEFVRLDKPGSVSGLIRSDSVLPRSAQTTLPKEGPQ